jgi:hypothetical protein
VTITALELESIRHDAEMTSLPDEVVVTRPQAGGDLDPVTAVWTPSEASVAYAGPGRVRPPNAAQNAVIFGDAHRTKVAYVGTFPFDAGEFRIDDVVRVTHSSDPAIAGVSFRVVAVMVGSYQIMRRVGLEQVD